VLVWWASALSSEVQKIAKLPDKMISLERRVLVSETKNEMLLGVLGDLKVTITQVSNAVSVIGKEQARRSPIVNRAERELFKN